MDVVVVTATVDLQWAREEAKRLVDAWLDLQGAADAAQMRAYEVSIGQLAGISDEARTEAARCAREVQAFEAMAVGTIRSWGFTAEQLFPSPAAPAAHEHVAKPVASIEPAQRPLETTSRWPTRKAHRRPRPTKSVVSDVKVRDVPIAGLRSRSCPTTHLKEQAESGRRARAARCWPIGLTLDIEPPDMPAPVVCVQQIRDSGHGAFEHDAELAARSKVDWAYSFNLRRANRRYEGFSRRRR